jgi:hypothetical protein
MLYLSLRRIWAVRTDKEWAGARCNLAQPEARAGDFFVWIRRNPLKSPNSAKRIQGNASLLAWIYFVLLGFICGKLAHWLHLRAA